MIDGSLQIKTTWSHNESALSRLPSELSCHQGNCVQRFVLCWVCWVIGCVMKPFILSLKVIRSQQDWLRALILTWTFLTDHIALKRFHLNWVLLLKIDSVDFSANHIALLWPMILNLKVIWSLKMTYVDFGFMSHHVILHLKLIPPDLQKVT